MEKRSTPRERGPTTFAVIELAPSGAMRLADEIFLKELSEGGYKYEQAAREGFRVIYRVWR